jgi:hypothetical protein
MLAYSEVFSRIHRFELVTKQGILDNPVFHLRKSEIIMHLVGERETPDGFRPIQDYLDFPCGYLQSSSNQLFLEIKVFGADVVNIFILFVRNNYPDILGGETLT